MGDVVWVVVGLLRHLRSDGGGAIQLRCVEGWLINLWSTQSVAELQKEYQPLAVVYSSCVGSKDHAADVD